MNKMKKLLKYKLTEQLSTVYIKASDWNIYEWNISTRNQTTNENWLYEIMIEVVENVMDDEWSSKSTSEFLQDGNTYTVEFHVISDWIWLPNRCFSKIWLSEWVVNLYDWSFWYEQNVDIISKWNDWTLVDNFVVLDIGVKILCDEVNLLFYGMVCVISTHLSYF